MLRRWQRFPETAPKLIPPRPKRLRDIDHLVIAPSAGFTSAEDYYIKTQPGPKLASIRQPLTIIFSKDDPVVPFAPLFDYPHSSSIETIVTNHGGHLGFLGQPGFDADIRWIDWRIIEWLEDPSGVVEAFQRRSNNSSPKSPTFPQPDPTKTVLFKGHDLQEPHNRIGILAVKPIKLRHGIFSRSTLV